MSKSPILGSPIFSKTGNSSKPPVEVPIMLHRKSSPDESMQAPKSIFGVVESFFMSFSVDDYPSTMNLSRNCSKRLEVNFFPKRLVVIVDGIYSMPSHLSEGARRLIAKMLVTNSEERATIPQIF